MTLFECLKTFLNSDSTLAAKLPGGIRPHVLPQTNNVPLATMRIVSAVGEKPTHNTGASSWARTRIEITIWGMDYKTGEQTSLFIINMFQQFNGFLGGGSNGRFATTEIHGPHDVMDEQTRITGIQTDFIGMLDRSTLS